MKLRQWQLRSNGGSTMAMAAPTWQRMANPICNGGSDNGSELIRFEWRLRQWQRMAVPIFNDGCDNSGKSNIQWRLRSLWESTAASRSFFFEREACGLSTAPTCDGGSEVQCQILDKKPYTMAAPTPLPHHDHYHHFHLPLPLPLKRERTMTITVTITIKRS